MALQLTSMAAFLQNARIPSPKIVHLEAPPQLTGVLNPNTHNWLSSSTVFANNVVKGPESLVVIDNLIYTGMSDGWVVELKPVGRNVQLRRLHRMATPSCRTSPRENTCGRPLGIRRYGRDHLVVADPYRGIYKIHRHTGHSEQLVDSRQSVNSRPLGFLSDVTVARDGTIFFSSASTKWDHAHRLNVLLEAENTGRVLMYRPQEKDPRSRVQELVTKLSFPDGLQLSQDETYLLIAERTRARIFKAHVSNSPKRGTMEVFAANLPGFVDNIRLTPRGTYWVGLSGVRHKASLSILDRFGDQPARRRQFMARPPSEVLQREFPHHGMAVELDERGRVVNSLQDPTGRVFPSVSQVQEVGDFLFVVSPARDYIGLLSLRAVLNAGTRNTTVSASPLHPNSQNANTNIHTNTNSNDQTPTILIPNANPNVVSNTKQTHIQTPSSNPNTNAHTLSRWLAIVSEKMKSMTSSEVRDLLVKLVFKLLEATAELKRAGTHLVGVENELLQFRAQFNRGLTEHQKQLIRRSWQTYNSGPGVTQDSLVIFLRLFRDAPDTIPLFSQLLPPEGVGNTQALMNSTAFMAMVEKVVGAIHSVVTGLDNPQALASSLRAMGARHSGYGVKLKHLPPFKAGMFEALEKRLGSSFSLESRQAWDALLDLVFSFFQQGLTSSTPSPR